VRPKRGFLNGKKLITLPVALLRVAIFCELSENPFDDILKIGAIPKSPKPKQLKLCCLIQFDPMSKGLKF
jgi:hypothetical protein